ncbi:MAG: nucleoside hydrolase [Candidatus Tectimicrobiota bacterium]
MTVATRHGQARAFSSPRPVAIDTDPGIDDALALMLALRSPEIAVELLTTVAGNVPVALGTANAQRLLAIIEPPVWPTVAQGAARPLRRSLTTATLVHGDDGLGGLSLVRSTEGTFAYPVPVHPPVQRQAARRLVQLVQQYGAQLTVIALGPLTNIAQALRLAPDIMQRLGRLVIMGGAIGVPGNISPTAEFNIFVDPHAADLVLRSGLPITLIPLDVTRQVRFTPALFHAALQEPLARLARVTQQMTRYALQSQEDGMAMHDPLAVAVALDPTLVELVSLPVCVETRGTQTCGMTVADRRPAHYWDPAMPRIAVALSVDAPRVLDLFARRVLAADGCAGRPVGGPHA